MKLLEATCIAGVVKVGALPVLGAEILSEGVGSSSGILLLQDDDGKIYLAKTSGDLKTTLTQLSTALTHVATALTALDAKPIGTLPPAPAVAANVAAITAAQAALSALKEVLK
jgi:hypothetical protein